MSLLDSVRWGSTHSEFCPIGNGVQQGGILSPLLFNVYMDDLSLQLHRQPIGCSVGGTVVNHMLYADDIVLFAPSAKGLQKLLDLSHTYGCNHYIEFNPLKSSVMYIDSRKAAWLCAKYDNRWEDIEYCYLFLISWT